MNRAPWWKRSVRPDYIILQMTDAQIRFGTESRSHCLARYELQCRRLLLSYLETEGDNSLEIGRVTADEKSDASYQQVSEQGFGWARVVIAMYPRRLGAQLEDSSEGEPDSSLDESLEKTPKHEPSPFSSKRVIRESDTPHSRSHEQTERNEQRLTSFTRILSRAKKWLCITVAMYSSVYELLRKFISLCQQRRRRTDNTRQSARDVGIYRGRHTRFSTATGHQSTVRFRSDTVETRLRVAVQSIQHRSVSVGAVGAKAQMHVSHGDSCRP